MQTANVLHCVVFGKSFSAGIIARKLHRYNTILFCLIHKCSIESITINAVIGHFKVDFRIMGQSTMSWHLSSVFYLISGLLICTENSHWIDCVGNVMCSLLDRIALMCRSSFDMLHGVFYCKADIVKAMCRYLLGSLQGQGMIVSSN